MLSQGLAAALMFLVAGSIKHIFGEKDIRLISGAVVDAKPTVYAFLACSLSVMGFPITAGFIGYLLVFLGAVGRFGAYGAIALLAPLLTGAYLYFVISRHMLSTKKHTSSVEMLGKEQYLGYALLLSFIFLFGVLPYILLSLVKT